MTFYESVFIIRQDVASTEVDKITSYFAKIVKDNEGEVIKTEYWGLNDLAYKIGNNKKGHYVFLGIQTIDAISSDPSPILKRKNSENDGTVDVTINA
ncbi:30S ribosomal protein S6, partial [Pseudolycoriella hygida]